jgi:hypothetical protein
MPWQLKPKLDVAKKYLIVKKTNGSAYGSMYLAPIKPVLQSKTNMTGANVFTLTHYKIVKAIATVPTKLPIRTKKVLIVFGYGPNY